MLANFFRWQYPFYGHANERELDSEPAVSSPPGITAASLITTKQLMSQKISGDDTYDVITSSPSSSSDGSSNEFVKVEHSDVQRSAGLTDNTLPFGMLQLHNDENDKRKDDRKNFIPEDMIQLDRDFDSPKQGDVIIAVVVASAATAATVTAIATATATATAAANIFGLLLWALTYVSCWFSGLSLLILALLAVFTIPKVYEVYQEPIDRNMSIAKQHVGNVNTIIGEKIPFLKKSADSHEKSN
ncbi:Reticulon-4 [Dirofilaria immitis]